MSQKYDYKKLPCSIKKEAEIIFNDMQESLFLCGKKPNMDDAITAALYIFYKKNTIRNSLVYIKKDIYPINCLKPSTSESESNIDSGLEFMEKSTGLGINNDGYIGKNVNTTKKGINSKILEIQYDSIELSEVEYCEENNCGEYNYCYNFKDKDYILFFKGCEYFMKQIHIHSKLKHLYNECENILELHIIYEKIKNPNDKILLVIPLKSCDDSISSHSSNILLMNILYHQIGEKYVKSKFDMEIIKNIIKKSKSIYFYTFEESNICIFIPECLYINTKIINLWNKINKINEEHRFNDCTFEPIIYNLHFID